MTTEDFDVTKMAAHLAQAHAEKLFAVAQRGVLKISAQAKAHFRATYTKYVERVLVRYGRGKSFFVRSEAIPLYDFFIPLDLQTQVRTLTRPAAADLVAVSTCSILTGSGGSGKSMMMRHLLVSCISARLRTPIFLELRQLNQTDRTCRQGLLHVLQSLGLDADDVFLEEGLASGQFFLLLDGFDEVERGARNRIAKEIQSIAQQYPKTWLAVSSRPDSSLQGWDLFVEYRVAPLDIESAVSLVSRLPVDESLRDRFVNDMRTTLFKQHYSFLSNPLLLSIMLLTYGDVAHIPRKLSTFYRQAYEALFLRHDALKGGFQRERQTALDIQDYSRAFAAFSLLSYDAREFAFGTERALALIANAREASMLAFDERAFLDDAVQAICLLLEDGLELAFAHRSFQEYFAAKFIQASPPEIKAQLIARLVPTVEADSVMDLLWEMDPYIVEKYYLLPRLAEIRTVTSIKKKVGLVHLLRYLRAAYSEFHRNLNTDENSSDIFASSPDWTIRHAAFFAYKHYRDWTAAMSEVDVETMDREIHNAFVSDFGEELVVPSGKIRLRGRFLAALGRYGILWGTRHLEEIMAIETEIKAKHENNRESLAELLAAPTKTPRRVIRPR